MFQAYVCDGVTGAVVDRVAVSDFSWERLLSARGSGTVSFPLDGVYTKLQLRELTEHWSRIWVLAWNDELLFMGYVTDRGYSRGTGQVTLSLSDLWGLLNRRGAWDHSAPNVHKWKTTVSGSLAHHAAQAIIRGRDTGPALPATGMPLTLPGIGGAAVSRTYYGYHLQTVGDVLTALLDEGLDIYFEPRFIANGDADWVMRAGMSWGSGGSHEFMVTVPGSPVSAFHESSDASRVTNNARRVGEGSEEDMLVRSNRNTASPYPLLDRVTPVKHVKSVNQLTAMANSDLALYQHPTFQWDFDVHLDQGVDVGDTVRLHFDGDPWIADGWHERRVVKVSGGINEFVTVSCQPTGGL